MAEQPQTYKNHARFYPPFHFVVAPLLLVNLFVTGWQLYKRPSAGTAWGLVMAVAFFMLAFVARAMALTVQDRVIRLEMRLRLQRLLPPDLLARLDDLSRPQFVALRFASDAELPDLVRDVLAGKLATQKAIKERIRNWQGDYLRA